MPNRSAFLRGRAAGDTALDGEQTVGAQEAAIRKLVEEWASAVRRRDLAAVLRYHAADILMFDVPPPFQSRGIEAYAATWDLFFSWADDPTVFDIEEMNVTAGSDVAFVTAAMRCAGREAGGQRVELEFRLTMGLCKVDSQWVVVHEHHSVPATD
ncbi:MAG TPA: nuclear transport factor 2 family protein [Acidothermaceae bacterium]|nr:nuclear transport factor 2 family protein [Acidothermaceae bacterium]